MCLQEPHTKLFTRKTVAGAKQPVGHNCPPSSLHSYNCQLKLDAQCPARTTRKIFTRKTVGGGGKLGLERCWYWVIGYWVIFTDIVLLLGNIFFIVTPNMIPIRQHRPHDNHLDVCGAAIVSRGRVGRGVGCNKLYQNSQIIIIIIIIEF